MKNPLDTELKSIARDFGVLLRNIIERVDSRGLKSCYLRKHKRPVVRFLDSVASRDFLSPLATNYKRRKCVEVLAIKGDDVSRTDEDGRA